MRQQFSLCVSAVAGRPFSSRSANPLQLGSAPNSESHQRAEGVISATFYRVVRAVISGRLLQGGSLCR